MKPISIILIFVAGILSSCDKGYQIGFTNYNSETIDSVIVGNNKVVFVNIPFNTTTDYVKISKGSYSITCVFKSKKRYNSSVFISGKGSGKRTIQIDAINQISILEE